MFVIRYGGVYLFVPHTKKHFFSYIFYIKHRIKKYISYEKRRRGDFMREMKKRMKGLLALVLVFALAMNTSGILVKAGDNTLGYTGVLSTTIMQNVGDEVSGDSGGAFRIVDGQEYIDNGNFTVSGSETVYSARDTGTYVGDPTSYPSTATEKVPAEKAYTTLTLSDMTG